ncbi:GNAT family N-acetyltransferase [Vibrio parahaemolyticus]|uniref:GNAT family N-acetyltransferase n=1 Tax=Vibrio parahaemolyticus TaxID=670 RepID=UPI001A2DD5C8|nr:GNAT family N-acetyltransferase [Vibrio parahaemolyticus]EGQ7800939.1 GNAT family N-acetyltransferase [Vibrio parahaemolyticus]EGQ8113032.1 GNAT family N-acetyltransferase [Vibrio parahaemolyticus]EGQ8200795.1 GNAT family N-acetyltransferase [Vibrio parahaemolyticus]EGU0150585.1 GNAT family N-acetyltransferase [Vibrio parahaemolyticus]ELA9722890.1 GNAT family N-acetyltransferase [Vibrio parahaemolyticus]
MYSIEKASINHVERLVEIQISAFSNDRQLCGSGPPGYDSTEHQRACLENYFYFVIKDAGEVVGGFYYSVDEECLQLIRLYVEPSYQHQGVGKMVLDYLVRQVSTGLHIELETPTFNTAAHRFYERNGFQKVKTIDYVSGSSILYRMLV